MSTYLNVNTGQYENFENAVIKALESMDNALHTGESQEQEPETPVEDPNLPEPETPVEDPNLLEPEITVPDDAP